MEKGKTLIHRKFAVERAPCMTFESVNATLRPKAHGGFPYLATGRSLGTADGQWQRINQAEVEVFNLDAHGFDSREQPIEPNAGLRQTREMGTEVELDEAPPTTEVQLMMDFLQDVNRHQFGITDFSLGCRTLGGIFGSSHCWRTCSASKMGIRLRSGRLIAPSLYHFPRAPATLKPSI